MEREARPPYTSLHEYERTRDAVLDRITALLTADERVRSAWLSGSFGRGEADVWADVDLHVVIADEHLAVFLAEREQLYARIGRPLLIQGEMPADSMPAATFQLVVFPGPVEVDWIVGPLSRAVRPLAFRMIVDRAPVALVALPPLDDAAWRASADRWLTFFWAMAPIAVKYVGRGETRRVANQITLLSRAFIALSRLLRDPRGPEPLLDWTNRVLEPEIDAALPQLGPRIDPPVALAVIEAIGVEIERLHPALAERGIPIPVEMPDEVRRLAALVRLVLRDGPPPKRTYR